MASKGITVRQYYKKSASIPNNRKEREREYTPSTELGVAFRTYISSSFLVLSFVSNQMLLSRITSVAVRMRALESRSIVRHAESGIVRMRASILLWIVRCSIANGGEIGEIDWGVICRK
jgi:hypothetical protein